MPYETPRDVARAESRARGLWVVVCALMVAVIVACLTYGALNVGQDGLPTATITHDSLTASHTYDGEAIRWYVMIDPDTDIQYLVNDRGGCCPRLDKYGHVIGVQARRAE